MRASNFKGECLNGYEEVECEEIIRQQGVIRPQFAGTRGGKKNIGKGVVRQEIYGESKPQQVRPQNAGRSGDGDAPPQTWRTQEPQAGYRDWLVEDATSGCEGAAAQEGGVEKRFLVSYRQFPVECSMASAGAPSFAPAKGGDPIEGSGNRTCRWGCRRYFFSLDDVLRLLSVFVSVLLSLFDSEAETSVFPPPFPLLVEDDAPDLCA